MKRGREGGTEECDDGGGDGRRGEVEDVTLGSIEECGCISGVQGLEAQAARLAGEETVL